MPEPDRRSLRACLTDRTGATAIEYGLIAGMIALVIIAAVTLVGTDLQTLFDSFAGTF